MSDEFYERTVQFIEGTLEWLRNKFPATQHQWMNTRIEPGLGGSSEITSATRPNFDSFLAVNCTSCSAYSVTGFLEQNTAFGSLRQLKVRKGIFGVLMQPTHAARLLITAYLMEVTSLLADAAKIQELARNFTNSDADRHVRIKETALLDGFSSKLDEIDCGRGYRIRRLPPNEYARYIDLYSYSDRLRWFLREFAIEKLTDIDLTKPIPAPEGWPFQDPMIGHIVTRARRI